MTVNDGERHTTPGGRVWTWEEVSVTTRRSLVCTVHVADVGRVRVTVPGSLWAVDDIVNQVNLAVDARRTSPSRSAV